MDTVSIKPQTNTNTIYLVRDETFMLNATGRCTESIVTINNVDSHWIYTYNAKGKRTTPFPFLT